MNRTCTVCLHASTFPFHTENSVSCAQTGNLKASGHSRSTADLLWHCCGSAEGPELYSRINTSSTADLSAIENRSYSECRSTTNPLQNCCRSAMRVDFGLRVAMTEVRPTGSTVRTGFFFWVERRNTFTEESICQQRQRLTFAAFSPHAENLFIPVLHRCGAKLASFCLLPKNTTPGLCALQRLVLSLSCSCIKLTFLLFFLCFFFSFGPCLKIKSLTCRC